MQLKPSWLGLTLVLVGLLTMAGCEAVSFVAQGLGPDRGQAVYQIENRPTLVLVDDPHNLLVDRTLPGLIADRIAADLRQDKVVDTFVSKARVFDLQEELGSTYARTAIDQIGRAVGAEQVIHIQIDSLQLQGEPGVFEPQATVLVKLIDAVESRRLFPASELGDVDRGGQPAPMGYTVQSRLFRRSDEQAVGRPIMIARLLADRVGRDVARVFYNYPRRPAGTGFDD